VFINEGEPYRVSHPVDGGDATVSIGVDAATLLELTPADYRRPRGRPSFNRSGLRIDTRSQALAAELRHRLTRNTIDHLAAETLTLELIRHTLDRRDSDVSGNIVERPPATEIGEQNELGAISYLFGSSVAVPCSMRCFAAQLMRSAQASPINEWITESPVCG